MASIIKQSFALMLVGLTFASGAKADLAASAARGGQAAASLQVPFVRNQGQLADSRVMFYARTFGGTVYVTSDGQLVYALPGAENGRRTTDVSPQAEASKIAVIRETLVDADLTALPSGAARSGAVINSFTGNDPRRWQSDIPAFNGVQFGEIYAGIALEVHAAGDNVEKIFTVAPGADPSLIALRLEGAEGVGIMPSGELEVRTSLGPVRFTAPVAYQVGAHGERQSVAVAYALEGDRVGFCVGAFDASRPLVIDPLLASTFIGGTRSNVIRATSLDSETNVIVAGYTASFDFPISGAPYQGNWGGGRSDGFIAKFDPLLTNLLVATYLGGSGEDAITAMAVTTNGEVYVTGYTASTDFPVAGAAYPTYKGGAYDAFVAVLDNSLSSLTASTYLGGKNMDRASAVAINSAGSVYVAGYTGSTNFPTDNIYGSTFQAVLRGTNDAFVVRMNSALSVNQASTYVGGTSNDQAFGMAIDTNDSIYIAGFSASANFPVKAGWQMTRRGDSDAFVARLSGELTNMVAATYLGGASNEAANGIAIAPFTNVVCVVGYTASYNYPQNPTNNVIAPGYANVWAGGKDAFLTSLDSDLTNLLASTYEGGADDDEATAVLTSATPPLRIYMIGQTASSDFPVTSNAYNTVANGGRDAFVSCWNTDSTLQASTYLGGIANDSAYAMALQADGFSIFAAGVTASTNFPATMHAYNNDRVGRTNDYGFVTKLGAGLAYGSAKWKVSLADTNYDGAMAGSPSLGWDGTVYCGAGSNLYAFDAQGRRLWTCQAAGLLVNDAIGTEQQGMGCTPAIATNGTIYVTTSSGALQSISPAGVVNWTFTGNGQAFESSPAIGSDGTIYFGTLGSRVYAVRDNGSSCVCLWTNVLASSVYASMAVASNGTLVVASSSPAWLYILNPADGSVLQSWAMSDITYSASPSIGSDGRIYIGNGARLLCFDPTNAPGSATQTWNTVGQVWVAPAIGSNGLIYAGCGTNLYEFYPDGSTGKIWITDGVIKSGPAIDSSGSILVGSYNVGLYSFNPNGTTNWVLSCDDYVFYGSPLIRRDGTIYMTDATNLYAVCGSASQLQTNWPMTRHDVLHTGNVTFDAAQILRPTGLTASQGAYYDHVQVSWNDVPNAEYYELFRSQTNDLATAALYQTPFTSSFADTNIATGMIYYYWVRAATPVAMSYFSDFAAGGVPPLPPGYVTASKGNPTNFINVTWSNSDNAAMYYVYRSALSNGAATAEQVWKTNGVAYADTGIIRGLAYYYWVKASNGVAGISDFSSGDGFANKGGTPPLAPAGITATTNSYQGVYVAWGASTGVTTYAVYRNTSTVIPSSFMALTNGLTFADTTAESLLTYYYWIRATNAFGMGEFSTFTNGWRMLAPPSSINATKGVYPNKIRVSWPIEPAAANYIVYRNVTNDPATASRITLTSTNYADDLIIERGAGYYYWVQSTNAYGASVLSGSDIGGTVPRAPLNVLATDGTVDEPVTVMWDPSPYTDMYELYRQDSYAPWSLSEPLAVTTGTDYSDGLARPGLRYYYWVKATNQFGSSELSGFDTGYRPLEPPYAISASDGTSADHLYVTWSLSDNASCYELWRGTNSDSAAALMLVNAVTTNYYDDIDSVQGVLYYYWVKAKTTQFVSGFSPYDSGYRALRQVDIGVSDMVFLPTRMAVVGAPAAASFRVTNHGSYDMVAPNASVAYNFYISSNSVFGDLDDKWMGGTNVSVPLMVGESAVVGLPKTALNSLAVPSVDPGWYYIFVNIQHAAPTKWLDPNLANNTIGRNGERIMVGDSQPAGLMLVNDYNGDGYTDLAMYQESTGTWQIWFFGTQGFTMTGCGGPGFKAVPSDYDGDGKADFAVYQESTGAWKVWCSASDYALASVDACGGPGWVPVPGDYDGDGLADPAAYQTVTGNWRAWLSASRYSLVSAEGLGGTSWRPVPGDYDGDGKADPAIYQESTGTWRVWRSIWKYAPVTAAGLGGAGYRPVASDYDLDGIMDPAVFQASTGSWRVWLSSCNYAEVDAQGLGNAGTVSVPGDYDGDGMTDPAVYWESFGLWRLWLSSADYQQTELLAWPGDGYVPAWNN